MSPSQPPSQTWPSVCEDPRPGPAPGTGGSLSSVCHTFSRYLSRGLLPVYEKVTILLTMYFSRTSQLV